MGAVPPPPPPRRQRPGRGPWAARQRFLPQSIKSEEAERDNEVGKWRRVGRAAFYKGSGARFWMSMGMASLIMYFILWWVHIWEELISQRRWRKGLECNIKSMEILSFTFSQVLKPSQIYRSEDWSEREFQFMGKSEAKYLNLIELLYDSVLQQGQFWETVGECHQNRIRVNKMTS